MLRVCLEAGEEGNVVRVGDIVGGVNCEMSRHMFLSELAPEVRRMCSREDGHEAGETGDNPKPPRCPEAVSPPHLSTVPMCDLHERWPLSVKSNSCPHRTGFK